MNSTHLSWTSTIGVLLLSAVGGTDVKAEPRAGQEGLVVQTATPKLQTLRHEINVAGSLKPYEEAAIQPKIAGYVRAWMVDIGDRVKRDEVLAKLSVPEIEEEVQIKKLRVDRRESEVKHAKVGVAVAEAEFKVAEGKHRAATASVTRAEALRSRWDQEHARCAELAKKGVLDKETVDQVTCALKGAVAELDQAKTNVSSLQATLELNKAKRDAATIAVEVAQAKLGEARAAHQERTCLDYALLRAPFDGVVTRRNCSTGDFLPACTAANAGKAGAAPFVVIRTDVVRAVLDVPEANVHLIKDGAHVVVRLPAFNDREIASKVTRTSWALDEKTHSLRVEVLLPNPKQELRPGTRVNVRILGEVTNALTLPANAILTDDAKRHFCFVVADGKATRLNVKVGIFAKDVVEILAKQMPPIRPGAEATWMKFTGTEQVIVTDVRSIKEGQVVEVK